MATPPTDPTPRLQADASISPGWRVTTTYAVPGIAPPSPLRFDHLMEQRRSIRVMGRPRLRDVINTLAFATNVRQIKVGDPLRRSRRPSPSGGALHPVEILILWPGRHVRAFLYDPFDHQLLKLAVSDVLGLASSVRDIGQLVPSAKGAILLLAGDLLRVAGAYEQPDSLLWRDAGAVIQTLHLTATAYGQVFCPLGVLGGQALEALRQDRRFTAVGVAVIGAPANG